MGEQEQEGNINIGMVWEEGICSPVYRHDTMVNGAGDEDGKSHHSHHEDGYIHWSELWGFLSSFINVPMAVNKTVQ